MTAASSVVLDEVSMVGDDMARHLLAFGKPILVLGDPCPCRKSKRADN